MIPQAEKELEQKKEARRNIEKQVREIKDGKGNASSQIEAIQREIEQANNKREIIKNKQTGNAFQIQQIDKEMRNTEEAMKRKKENQSNIEKDR